MPHSTSDALVNGDSSPASNSKTLSHITSYPVVASGIDTFKANPYGKKSIDVVNGTYARFGKPVEGYLETPYQYAKPYVNKADELGEKALERVDGTFPIVKEKPETIYEKVKSWVFWPYNYANDAWTGMCPPIPFTSHLSGKTSKTNTSQTNSPKPAKPARTNTPSSCSSRP